MTLSQSLDEIEKRCPSGIERIDHECIFKLLEAVRILAEACEDSATHANRETNGLTQYQCDTYGFILKINKEALQKAQEILK